MADKKKSSAQSQQVETALIRRRISSSSDENEMSIVQLRKKLKALKGVKREEIPTTSSCKKGKKNPDTRIEVRKQIKHAKAIERPSTPRKQIKNVEDQMYLQDKIERHESNNLDLMEVQSIQFHQEVPLSLEENNEQLFGSEYAGDVMVLLCDNIFCRKKILNMALGSSHLATHLARKLLEGVFKPEALLNCTLTGQVARSQGKERQNRKVIPMDLAGRNAIIEFSIDHAHKRNWITRSVQQVERSMSQRIGEIKRNSESCLSYGS